MDKKIFFVILALLIFPFAFALGQSDGTSSSSTGSVPATSIISTTTPSTASPIKPRSTAPSPKAQPKPQPATPALTAGNSLSNTAPAKNTGTDSTGLIAIVLVAALAAGGIFDLQFNRKNNIKKKQEKNCDNIKQLIEEKKEELKEIAEDRALEQLAGDGVVGKVADVAEEVRERYEELQTTIEMLDKRYNLCMLSLPGTGEVSFQGKIIENSLNDKAILESLKVAKKYKINDWLINEVAVSEKQIEKLKEFLNDGPWYMHFWKEKGDEMIVVFKNKTFRVKLSDKNTWKQAIEYGESKGIPEKQLDFETK